MKPFFKINRNGCTRIVILIGNYAIKIANWTRWELFLHGLLANMNEQRFRCLYKNESEKAMAPVLFVIPGGLLSIQRRVRPVRHRGLFWLSLEEITHKTNLGREFWYNDPKPENFGYIGSQLVKIDIGT